MSNYKTKFKEELKMEELKEQEVMETEQEVEVITLVPEMADEYEVYESEPSGAAKVLTGAAIGLGVAGAAYATKKWIVPGVKKAATGVKNWRKARKDAKMAQECDRAEDWEETDGEE